MKPLPGFVYPAALAMLFGSTVMARADLVAWSYQWDNTPSAVGTLTNGVNVSNEALAHAVGSSDIVATNLNVFGAADPASPFTLTAAAGAYTLKMTLTDDATHATGTFTFTGQLAGSLSSGSAAITNAFTSLVTLPPQTIGNGIYSVSIGPYSPPGPPSSKLTGSIAAHVDVRAKATPEPSTLMLAGLGLSLLGLISWKQRRRAFPPALAAV